MLDEGVGSTGTSIPSIGADFSKAGDGSDLEACVFFGQGGRLSFARADETFDRCKGVSG